MKMSGLSRLMIGVVLGSWTFYGVASGDESIEGESVVLFEDSFERSELGDPWRIVVPSFEIKDGRLVAHQASAKAHTTISRVPLEFRNAVFEFSFRLTDGDDLHLVLNDQNCAEAHSGHISRVTFSANRVRISDDRFGAFRDDQYRAFLASDRTMKRDIYDAIIAVSLDPEKWHQARVNLADDMMEVTIDGTFIGSFRSPGMGHPTKTDFGFVTKGNLIEVDDVRVIGAGRE